MIIAIICRSVDDSQSSRSNAFDNNIFYFWFLYIHCFLFSFSENVQINFVRITCRFMVFGDDNFSAFCAHTEIIRYGPLVSIQRAVSYNNRLKTSILDGVCFLCYGIHVIDLN